MYIYAYNGSDWISAFKNISICDLLRFYRYCILVFALLRKATYIQIFLFESQKNNKSNQNLLIFFSAVHTCAH